MFDSNSRYNECGDTYINTKDGNIIRYKKRRFIMNDNENKITVKEFFIITGDRIDLLSSKYLGDPEQFWRLCDMNKIMHPLELTQHIGKVVRITSEG
jgi:hypothetical protein